MEQKKQNKTFVLSVIKKIVVLGPESTGKSTLCEQLAAAFNTLWVPEYAREYLSLHGKRYTYEDLLVIAHGQIRLEQEYEARLAERVSAGGYDESRPAFLFIDTNMYVMKVWCEFVFGNCHQWILDQIAIRNYDLYFLCNPDLPWTEDELREYPDIGIRTELYHLYREQMINQPVCWYDIKGNYTQRFASAVEMLKRIY
jgi:NadR type nicotinamide-nucleotide adenylyltransferase